MPKEGGHRGSVRYPEGHASSAYAAIALSMTPGKPQGRGPFELTGYSSVSR